jgi:hypothetical protein
MLVILAAACKWMKERTWSLILLQACAKETPKVSNSLLSNAKFVPATLKVPVRLASANRLSKYLGGKELGGGGGGGGGGDGIRRLCSQLTRPFLTFFQTGS